MSYLSSPTICPYLTLQARLVRLCNSSYNYTPISERKWKINSFYEIVIDDVSSVIMLFTTFPALCNVFIMDSISAPT